MSDDPVTVIVPVYGGLEYTRRCLESVVQHAGGDVPIELLVIDDASPELPIREYVDEFATTAAPFPITVLHNPENLGFVRTVNRGLRRAAGDVVILNSDTAVTAGWLDRLAAAAALPDVATVTPLTSHGSICTLPDVGDRGVRARRRRTRASTTAPRSCATTRWASARR